MMPPRPAPMMKPPQPSSTPYSLELLSEYAHTLDAMPLDLSRIFADLRELDAVLTSTVASVTNKIYKLIEMIEDRSASNEQRLWLLGEIAEEASKVRPGADDKIRIATQAADSLHLQKNHLTALATHLPEFEPAMLVPKTRYPHVSSRAYMMPHSFETGRRRRAPMTAGAWMGAAESSSPQKKRRIIQDEDLDYGVSGKSPSKKDRNGDTGGQSKPRGGPRTKKVERQPSPPESLNSVASPLPTAASNSNHHPAAGNSNRNSHNTASSTKRRANPHNSNAHGEGSLLESVLSRKEGQHLAPSSSTSHPSLMGDGFDNGTHDKEYWPDNGREVQAPSAVKARASTQSSLTTNLPSAMEGSPAPADATSTSIDASGDVGGEDGEDCRLYCYCDKISFGEMIGCDGRDCKREWFHITCTDLKEAPRGVWYCDDCLAMRKKSAPRGGKKRSGGGRANARNGS